MQQGMKSKEELLDVPEDQVDEDGGDPNDYPPHTAANRGNHA